MGSLKKKSLKHRSRSPAVNDDKLTCEIILLDPSQTNYVVTINSHDEGSILFNNVCTQLGGILEKDYFGLRYLDKHGQRQWLELNKSIIKQIKDKNHQKSTQMFSFRFKHYPKHPCEDLKQDLSRYLLYLQLRRDLYRGRLVGTSNEQYQMAAYILQAETGEFDLADIENSINVADLKILPHTNRKSEIKILSLHEKLKDLNAKEAEKLFLEEASKLQTYGVEPIPVKDQKENELFVGIVEDGISTFNGTKRAHTFPWQNILKLSYSQKMFMFQVIMDRRKHILGFKCESSHAACALWKWALDRKCFFTLEKGCHARRSRSGGSIFRKKKIHTFIGMSQKELTQSCENLQIIPQPHVARAQSMMTLMRSISSRNETSTLSNGIDGIEKGYATLPRSTDLKYLYSDSFDSSEQSNKKINKSNSQKSKSPSAAVGAVLDFMQALKETPILHRSSQSNFSNQLYNTNENENVTQPDNDKDETDSNVISEIIDIVNRERESMSFNEPVPIKLINTEKDNLVSDPVEIKAQSFYFPFLIISVTLLFISIMYGFGIIFHIHSSGHNYTDSVGPGEPTSVIRWLFNILGRIIFKEQNKQDN